MIESMQKKTAHDLILYQILTLVWKYALKNKPSPTIRDLSTHLGFSEEIILESLEYGKIKPASLHQ